MSFTINGHTNIDPEELKVEAMKFAKAIEATECTITGSANGNLLEEKTPIEPAPPVGPTD